MDRPARDHSIGKQKKTETLRSGDLRQAKMVKLSGQDDKSRAAYGMEPW